MDTNLAGSIAGPLSTTVASQSYSSDLTVAFLQPGERNRYGIYSYTFYEANTPILGCETHYHPGLPQIVEVDGMWISCGIELVTDLASEFKTETTVVPTEEVQRVDLVIPHEDEPKDAPRSRPGRYNYHVIIDGYYVSYDYVHRTLRVFDFWPSW